MNDVRPAVSTRPSSEATQLPLDVVRAASRRFVAGCVIAGLITAIYMVLGVVVWPEEVNTADRIGEPIRLAMSAGFAWYLWRRERSALTVTVLATICVTVWCFSMGIAEYWDLPRHTRPLATVSWTCVAIILYTFLIPPVPRHALIGTLLAASTMPLTFVLAVPLRGQPVPETDIVLSMLLPPYFCVALAYIPASAMSRMGVELKKARQLGSYELVDRLGAGGMGEVWRARHRMLVRPAAIKLIRADAEDVDRLRQRFELEAQTTANLESPHTVELYDFGVSEDGAFYYVMELLRGIDLDALVRRFGPQPASRVVFLLKQVCDSLDDAHRASLVHRDIKPANIHLANKGRRYDFVKVLDFGLVKPGRDSDGERAIDRTAENKIIGTPAFLPPEMSTGDAEIDGRTDLYALGCVAYYLLTGKLVFERDSAMKTVVAHAAEEPVPPSQRTSDPIPGPLEEIIMKCLAKKPEQRPASALELARLLEGVAFEQPWNERSAREWWSENLPETIQARPARDTSPPTAFLRPL